MNSISPPVWVPWGFWKIEGWFGLVKREFKNSFPFSDPAWDARRRTIWKPQLPAGGTLRGQRDSLCSLAVDSFTVPSRCGLEGLMLKLKLQYSGHLIWRTDSFEKTLMLRKIEGGKEGDDRGWDGWMTSLTQWTWIWASSGSWWWQGGLACCSPWGRKASDTTERLKWLMRHVNLWERLFSYLHSIHIFLNILGFKWNVMPCMLTVEGSSLTAPAGTLVYVSSQLHARWS